MTWARMMTLQSSSSRNGCKSCSISLAGTAHHHEHECPTSPSRLAQPPALPLYHRHLTCNMCVSFEFLYGTCAAAASLLQNTVRTHQQRQARRKCLYRATRTSPNAARAAKGNWHDARKAVSLLNTVFRGLLPF
jgi:hypothetical protein